MNNRMPRADAEIKRELSEILLYEMNDPRILNNEISVSWVKTSPDFTHCKVGIGVLSNDNEVRKEILNVLNKSSGYIKKLLVDRVEMRAVPNLVFELDNGFIYSNDIDKILATLNIPKEDLNNNDENNEGKN